MRLKGFYDYLPLSSGSCPSPWCWSSSPMLWWPTLWLSPLDSAWLPRSCCHGKTSEHIKPHSRAPSLLFLCHFFFVTTKIYMQTSAKHGNHVGHACLVKEVFWSILSLDLFRFRYESFLVACSEVNQFPAIFYARFLTIFLRELFFGFPHLFRFETPNHLLKIIQGPDTALKVETSIMGSHESRFSSLFLSCSSFL